MIRFRFNNEAQCWISCFDYLGTVICGVAETREQAQALALSGRKLVAS